MLRYLAVLFFSLVAAPVIAIYFANDVSGEQSQSLTEIAWQYEPRGAAHARGIVDQAEQLIRAAKAVLTATAALSLLYVLAALLVGWHRRTLALFFPAVVRIALGGLALLLALHGLLLLAAVYLLFIAGHMHYSMWILAALGFGYVLSGLLIVSAWRRYLAVSPLLIRGVQLTAGQLPQLTKRIEQLARRLRAQPPTRLILGLEPSVFVTSCEINLRGSGVLPRAETLYVPLVALRTLTQEELDAVIAHELGHFRGGDLLFTERFVPAFRSLAASLESVSEAQAEANGWMTLSQLPATSAIGGMFHLLKRMVSRITRQRELEADRAGSEVSSGGAVISAVVKLSIFDMQWWLFELGNVELVQSGTARGNLVEDFLARTRKLLAVSEHQELLKVLLAAHTSHPLDTHPSLSARAQALNVDASAMIDRGLVELTATPPDSLELQAIEREVTVLENEHVRLPGTKLILDARPELPPVLDVPSASGEVAAESVSAR